MHLYGFSPYFQILTLLAGLIGCIAIALSFIASCWLSRNKFTGSRWMVSGLLFQMVYLLKFLLNFAVPLFANSGIRPFILSVVLYLQISAELISMFGLLIFAIGLFLHARNQRGLQARVDELERILADVHSRER